MVTFHPRSKFPNQVYIYLCFIYCPSSSSVLKIFLVKLSPDLNILASSVVFSSFNVDTWYSSNFGMTDDNGAIVSVSYDSNTCNITIFRFDSQANILWSIPLVFLAHETDVVDGPFVIVEDLESIFATSLTCSTGQIILFIQKV